MGDFEPELADDDTLMRQAADGDSAAFGVLAQRHQTRLLRIACRLMGGNADSAADVVQEAFVGLWASAAQYKPEGKFRAYLLTLVYNQARNRWRQPVDFQIDDSLPKFPTVPGPEGETRANLFGEAIRRAVLALPDGQREVFILSQYEGFGYREIAEILHCPEGTVASRKHLAVESLRRCLKEWNTEESDTK